MESKLEIFQTVKQNLASIGFSANQSAFDKEQLLRGFEGFLGLSSLFIYLIHVANTPTEYMESIYMTIAGVGVLVSYLSMNINYTIIIDFIDEVEGVIDGSE